MNYAAEYAQFLKGRVNLKSKIKVIFDASDGTAGLVLKELLPLIPDCEGVVINDEPNGDFPAHGPNPLGEGALVDIQKVMSQENADLGVIFDGDADRVLFLSEQGSLIDSFEVFHLIKDHFQQPLVIDVRALAKFTMPDLKIIESKAGRLFIWDTMRKFGGSFGVERSGHYFFKDFNYFDSAILAAIHMMNEVSSLKEKGIKLSDALALLPKLEYPPEVNFEVKDIAESLKRVKEFFSGDEHELSELDGVSIYAREFAFNLRASATEPVIRLNLAARDKRTWDKTIANIKAQLR